MNKIVIVGHPASGYEAVQALLNQCGMATAMPSRREGLSPQAITATLCKAYKVQPTESVTEEEGFAQIEAAPVWQGMALDLMLGNLEQPLWGWADPWAIYTLDYWERLDPHLTFALVYDEPSSVLMEVARQGGEDGVTRSGQDLRRRLDNWAAYNGALLRFHLRHTGRSVLVHAQQVRRGADHCVEQLQPLLDIPLSPSDDAVALQGPDEGNLPLVPVSLPQDLSRALSASGVEPQQACALLRAEPVERYLIEDVLEHHPAVMQIYAELQSVANLPLDVPRREAQGAAAAAAWEALLRQRDFVAQLMVRLHDEALRMGDEVARSQLALQNAGATSAEALARLEEQVRQSDGQAKRLQEQSARQDDKLRNAGEENELLLTQLHLVQEELERYYLRLTDAERAKEGAGKAFDEANREIDALKPQLGSVQCELRTQLARAPDLSIVPSRALVLSAVRRVANKLVPRRLLEYGRSRRAESRNRLELEGHLEQIRQSRWFDAAWYLDTYPDVRQSGKDAAEHYHVHGWKEGRKPGPEFDTDYYLAAYPDVREADSNPLLHFIQHGADEGRQPNPREPEAC